MFETKVLEIRDSGTFIPAIAIRVDNSHYLSRRAGFVEHSAILLTDLNGGRKACFDPYDWDGGARTMPVAHDYITKHWDSLVNGDVVDVQFIIGETKEKKLSESVTAPY